MNSRLTEAQATMRNLSEQRSHDERLLTEAHIQRTEPYQKKMQTSDLELSIRKPARSVGTTFGFQGYTTQANQSQQIELAWAKIFFP